MSKPQSRVRLTAGRVEAFACPAGKSQAFLWDTEAPSLALRATPTGRKTYVFESRLNGATLRLNIGTLAATLEQARSKAKALAVMVDSGVDPREVERQKQAAQAAEADESAARAISAEREAVTVGEVWAAYLEERRPHWGALHYRDHIDKAKAGGEPSKRRGAGKNTLTQPGPLAALMPLQLRDLDQAAIERWAAVEGKTRPSSARLAWRLLTVFLSWCGEQERYVSILPAKNPAKSRRAREALGKPGVKSDVLTREQLSAWFAQVRQISNPGISAALQTMLLTGARPGEVMALRWEDLNTQWKGINIRDKVEGTREIPLTPYVADLLGALPRRNEWVFSSAYALDMSAHNIKRRATKAAAKGTGAPDGDMKNRSAEGRLTEPNTPHTRACKAAGLEGLTLHGLRRSFASLTEWLEIPAGVVAQIQGHKPSATAEKHYKRRPLDLLRLHHERIEAWVLKQAGVKFEPKSENSQLQAVA